MTMYDAPDLTAAGIDYLVQDASRLGLETKLLTGVIVYGNDPGHMQVICDGDTTALTVVSTIGLLPVGAQVTLLQVTNKGMFIIGSQVKALSAATLPFQGSPPGTPGFPETPNSGGGGGGAPAPGTTAPFSTELLHDTFNRGIIIGDWGTPDVGPSWITTSTATNHFNVVPGGGGMTLDAALGSRTMSALVGPVGGDINANYAPRNVYRWVKNIQATVVATAGIRASFVFAVTSSTANNARPFLRFYGNGTTSVIIIPDLGSPSSSEVFISGVTAHQPVDMLTKWLPHECQVWVALTSTGIDPNGSPTVTLPTQNAFSNAPITAGSQLFFQFDGTASEASQVVVGEIIVNLINWPTVLV